MTPIDQALIKQLHQAYCQLTGFELSMAYDRERFWYEYLKAGFNQEDLRLVLIHLKRGIRAKERNPGCLKFSNLIQPLQDFEMELVVARAHSRNNRPESNREEIIEAYRPQLVPEIKKDYSIPVKEVIKRLTEEMRKAVDL